MIAKVLSFVFACVAFASSMDSEYDENPGDPSPDSEEIPAKSREEYESSLEEDEYSRMKDGSPLPGCEDMQRAFGRAHGPLLLGGANASSPEECPWMLALHKKRKGRFKFSCGASVIGRRWVLTAAHCLRNKGAKTRNGNQDCLNRHERRVRCFVQPRDVEFGCVDTQGERRELRAKRLYPYDQYDVEAHHHDIALVELEEDLPADRIVPICLSKGRDMDYAEENTFLLGWGRLSYRTAGKSKSLKKTQMDIMPRNECQKKKKGRRRILCATGERYNSFTCRGDSGGPLIHVEDGLNYIIGVTNTGARDCRTSKWSSFASVSDYAAWIKNVTEEALESRRPMVP